MAIVRRPLSAATNGQGISFTTGAPTVINTSTTAANTVEEVHIWASNVGSAALTTFNVYLTVTAVVAIQAEIPYQQGLFLVVPGLFMTCGNSVWGQSAAGGSFLAYGFVNRLTTGA